MQAEPGRRYLSISLPRLATDRIARLRHGQAWRLAAPPDAPPLVIAGRRSNALRLTALDEKADAAGLACGMGLADARAIMPGIEAIQEDAQADGILLEAVADWCDRYTPLVALDRLDGLILDITGCARLFGGETSMLGEILSRLFHQGFAATGAVAPTPGAAFALSRFKPLQGLNAANHCASGLIVSADNAPGAIAPLPLAALRLDGEMLSALARLGLRSIGQIMARPRAPLARRFGKGLLLRLDQALGSVEEAISPRLPAPLRMVERRLAEAISRTEDIETLVERLAASLCQAMERRGEGARILDLALFRVDGAVTRTGVGTSQPLRDPQAIARLFHERLAALHDDMDAGCGFDLIRLAASSCEPLELAEPSFLGTVTNIDATASLTDKLAARLGGHSVLRARFNDSHLPENAETLHPACEEPAARDAAALPAHSALPPQRPLRLFARPEAVEALAQVPDGPPVRFRWRRVLHDVVRAEGPERIAGEWWRNSTMTRDYYRIEDGNGRRFWLFREGLYGADAPRWFVHGLFA